MLVGRSPLGAVTVVAMAVVGAQQHTGQVMVVDGVQAGEADITVLAMVTLMLVLTMRHPWFMRRHQ
jgi:hypothetical protein